MHSCTYRFTLIQQRTVTLLLLILTTLIPLDAAQIASSQKNYSLQTIVGCTITASVVTASVISICLYRHIKRMNRRIKFFDSINTSLIPKTQMIDREVQTESIVSDSDPNWLAQKCYDVAKAARSTEEFENTMNTFAQSKFDQAITDSYEKQVLISKFFLAAKYGAEYAKNKAAAHIVSQPLGSLLAANSEHVYWEKVYDYLKKSLKELTPVTQTST